MSKRANKNKIRTEKLYTPWHKPMIITIKPEAYKLNKITNQYKKSEIRPMTRILRKFC